MLIYFHPILLRTKPPYMEFPQSLQAAFGRKIKLPEFSEMPKFFRRKIWNLFYKLRLIGVSFEMDDYEKRKLSIFNQLNFFQLVTGVLIPVITFIYSKKFPPQALFFAMLPSTISAAALILNACRKYHAALLNYFIFYPVFTC